MVMASAAGGNLIEKHNVNLPTVASVGMTVFLGAWWLSARLTKIDDRLETLERDVEHLDCIRNPEHRDICKKD